MKMDELAQTAMDAVTSGRVKIVPERYAKGYLDWLSEKRDWPIGRQLWWGHRIPVWRFGVVDIHDPLRSAEESKVAFTEILNRFSREHDVSGDITTSFADTGAGLSAFVCARTEDVEKKLNDFWRKARSTGHPGHLTRGDIEQSFNRSFTASERELHRYTLHIEKNQDLQETDVLDTWFSSALWPHSTLGWPDQTAELKRFYPTTTLITSRDIITLWVARMVLAGLYNVGDVPFHEVYITPKILDGYGETMSKSKGNGVDPIDVIEKFGADALRFGLAYLTTDTQDVKLPVDFECPHCGAQFPQTKKNRQLPRIECEKCGQPFSTQWAEKPEDKAQPRGAVVSERFELGPTVAALWRRICCWKTAGCCRDWRP
jgi:valyl-tRNA synthetase